MKIFSPLIFICGIFFISNSYSQKRAVDSLEILLKNAKHDTIRIDIYLNLIEVCEVTDNLKYAEPALKLVDKNLPITTQIKQRKRLLDQKAQIYESYFIYYSEGKQKDLEKVIGYQEKILKLFQEAQNTKRVSLILRALAENYKALGNYLKELDYFQKGLLVNEQLQDTDRVAKSYYSIGSVYFSQKDTNLALDYFEKSLDIFKQLPHNPDLGIILVKVGSLYECKKNYSKANKLIDEGFAILKGVKDTAQLAMAYSFCGAIFIETKAYDKVIECCQMAIKLAKKRDTSFVGGAYNAIGKAYFGKNNFKTSLEFYTKGLSIAEQQNDESMVAQALIGVANCCLKLNKNKEAAEYGRRALILRKKEGLPMGILYAEKIMFKADSSVGNYKEAFEHYKNYIDLRDKLNGDDVRKEAAKQKFKDAYDKEKEQVKLEQTKKDSVAAEEKKNQRSILFSVVAGLLLLLIFLIFVFRNLRITRKQKHIIEEQKELVEEKHKEITDSINYAERIQRSFLASNELLNQNLKDYFIFFQPKDVVSGDFYWASKTVNSSGVENFILVTADSTGHGVPGAIMSILNISSLEKSIEQGLREPADILNHTRKTIIERLKKDGSTEGGKDGMDASLISFDFKNDRLTYSAANNPVWIVRASQLIELAPDKMPVGKHDRDSVSFTQHIVELKKGDVVYALTDGMPDQFGGSKGKKFLYKKLKELLINISILEMPEQKEILKNSFIEWKGKLEQVDDVTVIGIKI